jgi:D-glycero-D-manno-heptose 1,7-bisphosphate phosphatase
MGRYSEYFNEIWKLQANRKVIGITLFGVLFDNSVPFTPGNQLTVADGADKAIQILTQKGYDFVIIAGQAPSRTKNLDQQDFENILNGTREIFESMGARIKSAYYSPGTDKSDPYVKPNIGMFERAQSEGFIKWDGTYYVGAESNDVKAAAKVKSIPVLIKSGKGSKTKAFELTHQVKVQEFDSLLEFANSI